MSNEGFKDSSSIDMNEEVDVLTVLEYEEYDEPNNQRSGSVDSGCCFLNHSVNHQVKEESVAQYNILLPIAIRPTMWTLLNEFCYRRTVKELMKYGATCVPELEDLNFTFGRFTLNQIYCMSQTTLWRLNCAYGRKIRKMICAYLKRPLPIVPDRKRNKVRQKKFTEKEVVRSTQVQSENNEGTFLISRTSPKKQVAVHEFCIDILCEPFYAKNRRLLQWIDESQKIFRICDSETLSALWTKVKDNSVDSAENFGRAIRFSRSKSKYFNLMKPQPKKSRQFTRDAFVDYEKRKTIFQKECNRLCEALE